MPETAEIRPAEDSLERYAAVVLALADICDGDRAADAGSHKRRHAWYLYRQSFYGFLDFVGGDAYLASAAAAEAYRAISPGGDLRRETWADQPRFDPEREIFHLEHVYTGGMFRSAVAALRGDARTPAGVAAIVRGNYRAAWILKAEDARLPKSDRGATLADALAAYEAAGITLVSAQS